MANRLDAHDALRPERTVRPIQTWEVMPQSI
jgi:hypothetical protein